VPIACATGTACVDKAPTRVEYPTEASGIHTTATTATAIAASVAARTTAPPTATTGGPTAVGLTGLAVRAEEAGIATISADDASSESSSTTTGHDERGGADRHDRGAATPTAASTIGTSCRAAAATDATGTGIRTRTVSSSASHEDVDRRARCDGEPCGHEGAAASRRNGCSELIGAVATGSALGLHREVADSGRHHCTRRARSRRVEQGHDRGRRDRRRRRCQRPPYEHRNCSDTSQNRELAHFFPRIVAKRVTVRDFADDGLQKHHPK
jgi:hypothetical protein